MFILPDQTPICYQVNWRLCFRGDISRSRCCHYRLMKKGRKTIAYLHEKKDNGEKIVQICPADRDKYFVMAAVHFQPHLSSGGYYDNMNNSDQKIMNGEESMEQLPNCPKCNSEYTYEDGELLICPECAHEWTLASASEEELTVKDANGNVLSHGDMVILIKDLKVKGSSQDLKKGTKVKNIRLVDGDHNIDCKIDGFGAMSLKSEFVKKA